MESSHSVRNLYYHLAIKANGKFASGLNVSSLKKPELKNVQSVVCKTYNYGAMTVKGMYIVT
jgi:hypothetical protein